MKIAIFFNSPYLGGAERSLILQSQLLPEESEKTYFVPRLDTSEDDSVKRKIREVGEEFQSFRYPTSLFSISREGSLSIGPLSLMENLLNIFLELRQFKLGQYDYVWANGNKIALILFLFLGWGKFSGKLLWHFRDYPASGRLYRLLWGMIRKSKRVPIRFIANSDSVKRELEKTFGPDVQYDVLYNPPSFAKVDQLASNANRPIKRIGLVAMFAPWKGLHVSLLGLCLYQEELIKLGIEEVRIYGAEIYQTTGRHRGYGKELERLVHRLGSDLKITFCGLCPPESIFREIDLLIHSSIKPEPFGRVIIEAFQNGVPVISSCEGGAGELVEHQVTGIESLPHDYVGQLLGIEQIAKDPETRMQIIQNAFKAYQQIHDSIAPRLRQIFS